jgi:mRNA-degrading endonuclease toxin of MazEF toxin-antitoxin module
MRDDLIVVPVFSTGREGPTRVMVSARSTGLRHDSIAFCDEVTTIDRDFLFRGPVGTLSKSLVHAVVRGVRRALGDVVAEP